MDDEASRVSRPRLPGARRAPAFVPSPDVAGAPPPEGLHVQFGADAASQAAVSWTARAPAARPRLRLGEAATGPGLEVPARERTYTDALTGEITCTYHATVRGLAPGTAYVYEAVHDGAPPAGGAFRTGPRGRAAGFRFTSFGDQSIPAPVGRGLGPATANAGYVTAAVEALDPLFHLLNGDLSYANLSDRPVATWRSYFAAVMRSARHRPWMPAAGNHENEVGNGRHGLAAYLAWFELPGNGSRRFAGHWYAFTVGPVRILSLRCDDVCLQDGGFLAYRRDEVPGYRSRGFDPYLRGYSGGAQRAWLAAELAAAAAAPGIDWIVVVMHQVAMSSARLNGADLGIRREFLPLFDAWGVDLVLAGHEHHVERTYPVRGTLPGSDLLTPAPQGSDPDEIDTRLGAVHMVLGAGGHPVPTPRERFGGTPAGAVIADVGPGSPVRQRPSLMATEPAPWSAYRDLVTPYGFASFDLEPAEPGGTTSITVTHYGAAAGSPVYRPLDRFVLRKPVKGGGGRGAAPEPASAAGAGGDGRHPGPQPD